MRRCFLMLCLIIYNGFAVVPKPYAVLAGTYEKDIAAYRSLLQEPVIQPEAMALQDFESALREAYVTGFALERCHGCPEQKRLGSAYLQMLRALKPAHEVLLASYRKRIALAMNHGDTALMQKLLESPLSEYNHERLKSKIFAWYKQVPKDEPIPAVEALLEAAAFEAYSREAVMQMQVAYAAKQRLLQSAREGVKRGKKVYVSADKESEGIVVRAYNRNIYPVTISVTLNDLQNLRSSKPSPYRVELAPKSELQLMKLTPEAVGKAYSYQSHYSWVMGRYSARHDHLFLYRLPFKTGKRVRVTQGFNGKKSHKERSRYAVDFGVPVGTPVYAARSGRVVTTEARHNRGKLERGYGKYANYIFIEHGDGSYASYFHLKQNGVAVAVGQKIAEGELIGYSGNTGYSSGPHLHFSVGCATADPSHGTQSVPIRLKSAEGVVEAPKKGAYYTVSPGA